MEKEKVTILGIQTRIASLICFQYIFKKKQKSPDNF
jgi:hypothetical protein